jgi:hypothetical protein
MKTEVFRVDSTETGELLFIAAWIDAKVDWANQLALLKKGTHPIPALQSHFNKYGEPDMVFSIIKKVESEKELIKVITEAKEPKKKESPKEDVKKVETADLKPPETEKAVIKEVKKLPKKTGKKK